MDALLHGRSRTMAEVIAEAEQIAATDSRILITGESGVGKELLARLIHGRSQRRNRPMLTVNCGGLPETLLESELFGHVRGSFTDAHRDRRGLLEAADGGTVLLDEVGEMSLRMQALLLRFLESGEIQRVGSEGRHPIADVRVISATNRDLYESTKRREFREDLYYRLNVVHVIIPPLRARHEDIPQLMDHYMRTMAEHHHLAACSISPSAMAYLQEYRWPGNVRELKNVAERLTVTFSGREVSVADAAAQMHRGTLSFVEPATAAVKPDIATVCWERMTENHESFWTVVYEPFMSRDLTRETVRALIRRGLEATRGSYRLLAAKFNLPPTDYKRFLNFVQKYDCHIAFQSFRMLSPRDRGTGSRDSSFVTKAAG